MILMAKKSIATEENLWTYLGKFRNSTEMPSAEEIKNKFGEPDDYMEMEENTSYPVKLDPNEYYRFTDEDKQIKWLSVVAWRYYWQGDKNRWVDVIVRKVKGTILGWVWFENVPIGEETGPPK